MTDTNFSAVTDLGELRPDYFRELMHHEDTRIEIWNGDRRLTTIEDPSHLQAGGPEMVGQGGMKKIKFRVNHIVERKIPDAVEEPSDDGTADEGDNERKEGEDSNEGENDSGRTDKNTENMTFTMGEGPSR